MPSIRQDFASEVIQGFENTGQKELTVTDRIAKKYSWKNTYKDRCLDYSMTIMKQYFRSCYNKLFVKCFNYNKTGDE